MNIDDNIERGMRPIQLCRLPDYVHVPPHHDRKHLHFRIRITGPKQATAHLVI